MRIRKLGTRAGDKIDLQMTPMIDVVFQLLVFFIMTFQIVAVEGDFNIKMPLAGRDPVTPTDRTLQPMVLRLTSAPDGQLRGVRLDARSFEGKERFSALRNHLIGLLGDNRGPNSLASAAEIEIVSDYDLHYQHIIAAITAVTGYLDDGDRVVKLIEKIKFRPPTNNPSG